MMSDIIETRALLVSLRLSFWAARKYDRAVSREVADAHDTDLTAGRYNKHLLPGDATSYKELQRMVGEVRTTHYAQTLAWSDEGWRLLPVDNYFEYTAKLRSLHEDWEKKLERFLADYPQLKANAQTVLKGMFHETDYPPDLRTRFAFEVSFNPLPQASDYRIKLLDADLQKIEAETESRVKQAITDAQADGVNRLREIVEHMIERLGQPDTIFRDSLVLNAREVSDALRRMNILQDDEFDAICVQVHKLAEVEPAELREDESLRQDTARQAEDILDNLTRVYGVKQ